MRASIKPAEWSGFRSILCPIDFSKHAQLALRYAEAIARRARATLTVAYVNDPFLVAAAAVALHDPHFVKQSATELQRFIDETLTRGRKPQLRIEPVTSIGQPAAQILKAAARTRSDLIVLGTHGLTGADRLIMGSTTLGVLRRTRVPVLAVPRSAGQRDLASWPGHRIAAAVDFGPASTRDIDSAARVARWFDASLLLIHVVGRIAVPAWIRADARARERTRVTAAQRRLDKLAVAGRRDVETETRVVAGDVAEALSLHPASEGARLLMTTLRDRPGWFGPRRGSVTYHVLTRAAMPILACPARWRPS